MLITTFRALQVGDGGPVVSTHIGVGRLIRLSLPRITPDQALNLVDACGVVNVTTGFVSFLYPEDRLKAAIFENGSG